MEEEEEGGKHVQSLGFLHGFLASISVIIVSEIGDKTFFIAAILAMKYSRCVCVLQVCVCVCVCVCACVRACVRACVFFISVVIKWYYF